MFRFVAKHRGIWPVAYLCEALGVSRSGFYAWLTRRPSARSRRDEVLGAKIRSSFQESDRTYGARRVWHDLLAAGIECGLHAIERLMRRNGLRARPRRRRLPIDLGDRSAAALSARSSVWQARSTATRDQARADVFDYIERFYNPRRRHSTIGYISPMEFEAKVRLA
jgi:putative transposase